MADVWTRSPKTGGLSCANCTAGSLTDIDVSRRKWVFSAYDDFLTQTQTYILHLCMFFKNIHGGGKKCHQKVRSSTTHRRMHHTQGGAESSTPHQRMID